MITIFSVSACQTLTSDNDWPNDIPARNIFIEAYYEKRNTSQVDDKVMQTHLGWILRFYQGTVIYPNGWNRASELFLDSIPEQTRKTKMQQRLVTLGIEIANEWAQDNALRHINSNNMATWGSALKTAAERGDQENFIDQIEDDVNSLIARELTPQEISYQRYYPEQDYDDF